MTNHVHLLVTPRRACAVAKVMQSVGVRYVQRFNESYARTGTLWEGRYRSAVIESEQYFWTCQRYVELNPLRAGLVRDPAEYPWSSYRANAFGAHDALVTPHELYGALASEPSDRHTAYRGLFDTVLPESTLDDIRLATNTGWALGSDQFRDEVAELLGRRTAPSRGGRPARWNDEIGVRPGSDPGLTPTLSVQSRLLQNDSREL